MEITDEMRRAVLSEICELERQHQIDLSELTQPRRDPGLEIVGARDETKMPHIRCSRCGRVWIVFPAEGQDYEDAERRVYGRLDPKNELAKQIVRARGRRDARDRPPRPPRPEKPPEPPPVDPRPPVDPQPPREVPAPVVPAETPRNRTLR